jgi:hypothetical protein
MTTTSETTATETVAKEEVKPGITTRDAPDVVAQKRAERAAKRGGDKTDDKKDDVEEDGPVLEKPKPKLVKDYGFFKHVELGSIGLISLQKVRRGELLSLLSQVLPAVMGTGEFESYNLIFPIDDLAKISTKINSEISEEHGEHLLTMPHVISFFEVLRLRSQYLRDLAEARVKRGVIEGSDLPILFEKGSEVIVAQDQDPIGGIVTGIRFISGWSGAYWIVSLKVIISQGNQAQDAERDIYIRAWAGIKPLAECEIKPAKGSPILDQLIARGRIFREVANGVHYMRCDGQLTQASWMGDRYFTAQGRVMVDSATFGMMDSDQCSQEIRSWNLKNRDPYGSNKTPANSKGIDIKDEDLWRCNTHVLGFSFRAKRWGSMRVADISQIRYREDAFDHLVLEDELKDMIRALVENSTGSFSDLIDGKGGGCIFLLEGKPGQGKTLTAETVAEVLKRPLYPISVGELGTDPDTLEERLRQILDVATAWNAVLLLDEADIFLEARDAHNIVRNAMVGVFLRLLEYHEGVLFLTTNRAENIDHAFLSRISVALSFEDADEAKKRKIWEQLLNAASLKALATPDNLAHLSRADINGRQVKNAIRQAQTLARSKKVDVTIGHIDAALSINQQFVERLHRLKTETRGHEHGRLIAAE